MNGTMATTQWEVYIIRTKSGKLYTGITNNLKRRFEAHQQLNGARFFHFSGPEEVIFREEHPNRSQASKREIAIKKMSRQEKLELVRNSFHKMPRKDHLDIIDQRDSVD